MGKIPTGCKAGSKAPVVLEEDSQIDIASVGAIPTVDREETIHQIGNLEAFGETAVSLHIYSRPIDSCVVYDLKERSCKRVQLSYYSENGKVIAPV